MTFLPGMPNIPRGNVCNKTSCTYQGFNSNKKIRRKLASFCCMNKCHVTQKEVCKKVLESNRRTLELKIKIK